MKEYELWLDESGDFEASSQQSRSMNPSLVGGVLISKESLTDSEIRLLADPDQDGSFHSAEMDYKKARRIVPNALEGVCRAGGNLVIFENTERIDYHTNRELYLRILAAGLAQLVRLLSAQGPFHLMITVAVRLVPDESDGTLFLLSPEEYRDALKDYVSREFDEIGFSLDPASRIALTVLSGRQEARLALADYACNARFVLHSKKYRPVQDRLLQLFDPRYHFTVTALTAEERIRAQLSGGDVSGALLEFFTTRGTINRSKLMREILSRFTTLSYRLQRLQIRRFASELRSFAARETDFERSEALVNAALRDFFAVLPELDVRVQADESLFWVYLSLADMYLREGDVLHAGPVMEKMDSLIRSMNYRAENLAQLYFYRDNKALYEIDCMDYTAAVQTMSETIRTMEDLLSVLSADDLLLEYFGSDRTPVSEYLGNAYCMKIYAELFLQRFDRGLYESSIRADSDRALSMYEFYGELERNQQYRAKAENEEGRCLEALNWLLQTQNLSVISGDVVSPCVNYLASSGQEDRLSRCYYVMYYVEIMENAERLKQTDLSTAMMNALQLEKQTLSDLLLPQNPLTIHSDKISCPTIFEDIFSEQVCRRYHPLEIALWKYGSYLWRIGSYNAALQAWDAAVNVCDENPDYTALKLVAVAIQLERLSFLFQKEEDVKALRRELLRRCESILKIGNLPLRMADYVGSVREALRVSEKQSSPSTFYKLSRQIAY